MEENIIVDNEVHQICMLKTKFILTICFSLLSLLMAASGFSQESIDDDIIPTVKFKKKAQEVENCLLQCYHVDPQSIELIQSKLIPLIYDLTKHTTLDDFITKSNNLDILFSSPSFIELPFNDAVIKAPQWHEVLFESPHIRILWGVTRPNEPEPFHMHHWKSLMLITQGASFEIENADGSKESGDWPVGVYELPPDTQPSAYLNIGTSEFKALRFEIKHL